MTRGHFQTKWREKYFFVFLFSLACKREISPFLAVWIDGLEKMGVGRTDGRDSVGLWSG